MKTISRKIQWAAWVIGLSAKLAAQPISTAGAATAPSPDLNNYILTPPSPHTPRINGPSIYGERPGRPFLYAIPATGDRPMTFSAGSLPDGLKLNRDNGQITGVANVEGTYSVTLTAENALGTATRAFRIVIGDKIALTPAMGWNSWNSWANNVDQEKVLRAAKALETYGLINHGWTYVNIDDTWQGNRTGADYALQANEKFPDMKGLCDMLHGMGLKAGIYSTPWITSYAGYAGGSSETDDGAWDKATMGNGTFHRFGKVSFDNADAKQWAAWGFDYLKYDWNPNDVPHVESMSNALKASGRDFVFSLSNAAPFREAEDWARLANSWRTTGDITDTWSRVGALGFLQDNWTPYSGPGHWNDPDMLVVGVVSVGSAMHPTRLTSDEQYTHISMWCLLSAPLLIGCDMDKLDSFTLNLLTNDEVLAVDQDALGLSARQVYGPVFQVPPAPPGGRGRGPRGAQPTQPSAAPLTQQEANTMDDTLRKLLAEDPDAKNVLDKNPNYNFLTGNPRGNNPGGNGLVFAKPLEDGSLAVGLFNVGPKPEKVAVNWKDLGLDGRRVVRDLWRQQNLGTFENNFFAMVPSHGVVLVRIKPAP